MGFFDMLEREKAEREQQLSMQSGIIQEGPPIKTQKADKEEINPVLSDQFPALHEVDRGQEKQNQPQASISQSAKNHFGENPENFKAAWPWIMSNVEALAAKGWTRASLFQRGKHRFPVGKWGVAWFDLWRRDGLMVSLDTNGNIKFEFPVFGRKIVQTACCKKLNKYIVLHNKQ